MRNYSKKTQKKKNRFRTPSRFIMNKIINNILISKGKKILNVKKSKFIRFYFFKNMLLFINNTINSFI